MGLLSGGEQQRLRAGQALADEPGLLLCDEPLTSLDLANQQAVIGLIDRHRREKDAAVLLVTHDINPVLGKVDRILYLANGRFTLGTPDEVLTSRVLTDLYGAPVFVLRAGDRLVVVGAPDAEASHHHHARRGPRMNWDDIVDAMFGGLPVYGEILALVSNSVWAGAVLGLVGGLIGVFVMQRDMAFAVHGISELSFAGAAAALLIGVDVVTGSIVGSLIAAAIIGWLGARARDRNSIIGVLMPFGLGLGILFLSLYDGRSANRFSLLTGQIVSVQSAQLGWLIAISAFVLLGLLLIWRPLRFDSLDPQSAAARGVPTTAVSLGVHAAARTHRRRRGAHHRRAPRDGAAGHARRRGDARRTRPDLGAACSPRCSASSRRSAASCSRSSARCR